MCVSVCVRNHMITHLVDNSPYIHIYLYKHHCSHHSQQYRMPSKSAESISAWVAVCQLFSLLQVSNLWKHLSASPTEQWRTHWVFRHCSPHSEPEPILLQVLQTHFSLQNAHWVQPLFTQVPKIVCACLLALCQPVHAGIMTGSSRVNTVLAICTHR